MAENRLQNYNLVYSAESINISKEPAINQSINCWHLIDWLMAGIFGNIYTFYTVD